MNCPKCLNELPKQEMAGGIYWACNECDLAILPGPTIENILLGLQKGIEFGRSLIKMKYEKAKE